MSGLDGTLRGLSGYRLYRATTSVMARHKVVFAAFGLRRTTFSCLSLIVDTPGLQQSQLGKTLAIERPNLVNIVEDLVSAGLVSRETSPLDRRAYALHPTPKGRALFAKAMRAVEKLNADITVGLNEKQISALQTALDVIERNSVKLRNES